MELDIAFTPWQTEVYEDPARFKVVAAGRRCGKSYLAAWMLLLNALQSNKGWSFYVAPTQGQARQIMWKVLLDIGHKFIAKAHINNLDIELINGQTIGLRGADRPDTMRGVSLNYLVMDEYADMKSEVWEEVLRPTLTDLQAPALFIGTPKGRNHFYDMYSSADLQAEGFDNWSAHHYTSYDNPYLDPSEIDLAKKSMSSHAFRQEYMASFEAKGSNMFEESWVSYGDKPTNGSYFIACDLAGFAEIGKKKNTRLDNTAIAIAKVNEDGWFVEDIITGRWTLDETALKIFRAVEKYQPTAVGIERGIAKQAVVSPLSDLMRRYGRFFNVVELSHGNKAKTDRIMWALQGRFENGHIKLNKGDWNAQFLDELFQFPDKLTHDDMVDALSYIDQLAQEAYFFDSYNDEDEWQPTDVMAGY